MSGEATMVSSAAGTFGLAATAHKTPNEWCRQPLTETAWQVRLEKNKIG